MKYLVIFTILLGCSNDTHKGFKFDLNNQYPLICKGFTVQSYGIVGRQCTNLQNTDEFKDIFIKFDEIISVKELI